MRISLRTGGGRGVYELAGSQGDCKASDLFEKELYYELTPSLIIPGQRMGMSTGIFFIAHWHSSRIKPPSLSTSASCLPR